MGEDHLGQPVVGFHLHIHDHHVGVMENDRGPKVRLDRLRYNMLVDQDADDRVDLIVRQEIIEGER